VERGERERRGAMAMGRSDGAKMSPTDVKELTSADLGAQRVRESAWDRATSYGEAEPLKRRTRANEVGMRG
jgi:hypothetical protein